jgi:AraC-like DNA-binding protein
MLNRASRGSAAKLPEEKGRLSNPVQRRLSDADIDDLVRSHREGVPIDSLGRRFGVHRTTLLHHLDRRGVPRPPNTRKMTDRSVRQAETRYRKSESLKAVASRFGVDPRTLAREFSKAEIPTGSVRNFV